MNDSQTGFQKQIPTSTENRGRIESFDQSEIRRVGLESGYLTTVTGTDARRITVSATEPRSIRGTPDRP